MKSIVCVTTCKRLLQQGASAFLMLIFPLLLEECLTWHAWLRMILQHMQATTMPTYIDCTSNGHSTFWCFVWWDWHSADSRNVSLWKWHMTHESFCSIWKPLSSKEGRSQADKKRASSQHLVQVPTTWHTHKWVPVVSWDCREGSWGAEEL